MINHNVFNSTSARTIANQLGCFTVVEYMKDISVSPTSAQTAYFMSKMGVHKRQVISVCKDSVFY